MLLSGKEKDLHCLVDLSFQDFQDYLVQCHLIYSIKCVKNVYQSLFEDSLNVFQIISILTLTSYTSYAYKIQFLFNIFDLDSSKSLQFKQLILSFKSLIRGYCILTQQALPQNELLQKYGQIMFSRADLNNDQCLQLGQVLSWFQGNVEGIYLFKRFQPTDVIGKEDYYIFNSFVPYSSFQINLLYQRIQKEHKKTPLNQQDFQFLSANKCVFKKTESNFTTENAIKKIKIERKQSNFKQKKTLRCLQQQSTTQQKKVNFSSVTRRPSGEKQQILFPKFNIKKETLIIEKTNYKENKQNSNITHNQSGNQFKKLNKQVVELNSKYRSSISNSSREKKSTAQPQNIFSQGPKTTRHATSPAGLSWEATTLNLTHTTLIKKKLNKKKFQNIIILKGKTITKKQVFGLRDYFQSLSAGKKSILIQNFIDSFNEQKYNHMKSVAASLFNFLDKDQNGKVTFKELIQKLYPDLSSEDYQIIKLWNNEYNQTFNLQKKVKANRQHEELKKRILPKTCKARYQQMFNFFDRQKKGYVVLQDLKRILSDVSTQKQLMEAFDDNDKDKDGRLNLKEFMHVILPIDLEIEGI